MISLRTNSQYKLLALLHAAHLARVRMGGVDEEKPLVVSWHCEHPSLAFGQDQALLI
jgi:hypothetical protein